jgi:hypothetical protein
MNRPAMPPLPGRPGARSSPLRTPQTQIVQAMAGFGGSSGAADGMNSALGRRRLAAAGPDGAAARVRGRRTVSAVAAVF